MIDRTTNIDSVLIWLDGVARDKTGRFVLSTLQRVGRDIVSGTVTYPAVPSEVINTNAPWLSRTSTFAQSLVCRDLRAAERLLYPAEVFQRFSHGIQISENHEIYKIDGTVPIYIPAILLIRELFAGSRLLNEHLLLPGAVDRLGVAHVEGEVIVVHASPVIRAVDMTARLAQLLAWLLTNREAKLAHASILSAARCGKIAIDRPELSITGWARGIDLDPGLLAVQLHAVDIRLPLRQKEIIVHVGKTTRHYRCYAPPVRSPWSQTIPRYVSGSNGSDEDKPELVDDVLWS